MGEFECRQIIGFWKERKTYEAISCILKFLKNTVINTIVQYKNFNIGLTVKRIGKLYFMDNNDHYKLLKLLKKVINFLLIKLSRNFIVHKIKKFQLELFVKTFIKCKFIYRLLHQNLKLLFTEFQYKK